MATVTRALTPDQHRSWEEDGFAVVPAETSGARLLDLVAEVLGGPVERVGTEPDERAPGAAAGRWRRSGDDRADGGGGPPGVTAWVAVTVADLAAGCPWVVPGSHRTGDGGPPDPAATRPVLLAAGDLLLVHDRLLHRVTGNHTAAPAAARVSRFRRG
jgi:ectoine hydroxylase-related dioxygenase (phytanoyl-CoA dioxygenase family)